MASDIYKSEIFSPFPFSLCRALEMLIVSVPRRKEGEDEFETRMSLLFSYIQKYLCTLEQGYGECFARLLLKRVSSSSEDFALSASV